MILILDRLYIQSIVAVSQSKPIRIQILDHPGLILNPTSQTPLIVTSVEMAFLSRFVLAENYLLKSAPKVRIR